MKSRTHVEQEAAAFFAVTSRKSWHREDWLGTVTGCAAAFGDVPTKPKISHRGHWGTQRRFQTVVPRRPVNLQSEICSL